jgi:hypothetical protein
MTAMASNACLKTYQLGQSEIYVVGAYDKRVTVFSQQVRALNLAWALIEDHKVNLDTDNHSDTYDPARKQIAVVGAGFAGLTAAAGLLKNRVNADITIFEQRDNVLPLQQGCDIRWLHPHIYDWPNPGSEAFSATLPVLNWTANRASDVVVQILKEWREIVLKHSVGPENTTSKPPTMKMYCNTRYIRISEIKDSSQLTIEWLGDERTADDPTVAIDEPSQIGQTGASKDFDIVVLAIGFGLETGMRNSYWRNETYAQPQLGQARSTYIVSGAGDGALIDLCRLRIANFRQDRILAELFAGRTDLLKQLRTTRHLRDDGLIEIPKFWLDQNLKRDTDKVLDRLRERLRQDTTVLLRVLRPRFSELFDNQQVSFQNRLLAYLLYRCGAFTLVVGEKNNSDLKPLAKEHSVADERIIIRHGTQKKEGFAKILPPDLSATVAKNIKDFTPHQTDEPLWSGGYFDMPGMRAIWDPGYIPNDEMKSSWRKDYLPSPTEAVATAFCSAIAGFIPEPRQLSTRLRVTLHRRLISGDETCLQQCCAYQGLRLEEPKPDTPGAAGRTFPSTTGTIGAAYTLRQIVHTRARAKNHLLKKDMDALKLGVAARNISDKVASVAAIPLLGKDPVVLGVLYLESTEPDAFADDTLLKQLVRMCNKFLESLPEVVRTAGIANTDFWQPRDLRDNHQDRPDPNTWKALSASTTIEPPYTETLQYLNFDFSDFSVVEPT